MAMLTLTPNSRSRRMVFSTWLLVLGILAVFWLYPIANRLTRLLTITLLLLVWTGALTMWWKRKVVRLICFFVVAVVGVIAIAPGGPIDRNRLRTRYVASLVCYEGTSYVW